MPYVKAPKNGYCFAYISKESSINVFFDNFKVRHDRGRIIEENHYYPYGLKIAPLSSKAYGAPNNNYTYQGDYSEIDDDLGWHDFALRSYDQQTGRFLQSDPYEQFSSGYIGMGNDPVNMVDPSGGWGTGIGCAVAQGMAGYGGMTGSALSISSATMSWVGIAMKGISLTATGIAMGQNIGQHQQNARQGGNGNAPDGGGQSSNNVNSGSNNNCKCPPGYSTTPSGPFDEPYFFDIDGAAKDWSFRMRNYGSGGRIEYSSLIYSVSVKSGNSTTTLFAMTRAVRFSNIYYPEGSNWATKLSRYNEEYSPGISETNFHGSIPSEGTRRGHIHLHPAVSNKKDVPGGNRNFSSTDKIHHGKFIDDYFYLLGSTGILQKHYPDNLPRIDGFDNTPGSNDSIDTGYYGKDIKRSTDCKCYKK